MSNQAEANLSALIESTDDLIWAVDLDYRLIAFNTALRRHMEAAFGIGPKLGMRPKDLVPPERAGLLPSLYGRALAEGSFQSEFPLVDGHSLALTLNPILVDGKATGVSVFGKDITQRKAAEKTLGEEERKYRDIFNGALEGIFRTTFDGESLLANPALAKMLGYGSPEEFIASVKNSGRDVWADPGERARFLQLLEEQGVVVGYECEYKRRDGSIWVSLNCRKVPGEDGKSPNNEGFIEDISECRRTAFALAESDARFRSFFRDNASVMLLVEPGNGTILAANGAASQFYGYTLEELVGMPIDRVNVLPAAEVARERERAIREERNFFQFRHRLAGGQIRDVEVYSSPIVVEGARLLLSIVHDVTGRVEAEQTLMASAESLREAQTIAGLGSYVLDIGVGAWSSSEVLDEIFGIDKEYRRAVPGWTALIHPGDRAMMAAYFADEVLGQGKAFNREYRVVRQSDGEEHWVHGQGRLELDSCGQPLRMRGTIQDITARKRAEMHLRDSEERYRATFEQAAFGIVHTGRDGRLLRCNACFAAMLGYRPEEIPGLSIEQLTFPDEVPISAEAVQKMWSGEFPTVCLEKRYLRKDGSTTWGRVTVSMQRDEEGRPIHSIALVEDINGQKAAEERLAASTAAMQVAESRYRTVFQTSADAIVITRLRDGAILDANQTFVDSSGFERDEFLGRTSLELGIWTEPSDRGAFVEAVRRNGGIRDMEVLTRRKDGETFWMRLSATLIEIEGSECLLTSARDISESRAAKQRLAEMQEALRISELRYRTAFQMVQDSIDICRLEDGEFVDVNDEFVRITGFAREEVIGRTAVEIGIWADPGDRQTLVDALGASSTCRNLEFPYRTRDGSLRWGLLSASRIDLDGVPSLLSVTHDITEAKTAEQRLAATQDALRESETRYRTAFQTSVDGICISRIGDGKFIEVNKAYLDMMGYERDEMIGRTSIELNFWVEPELRQELTRRLSTHSRFRDEVTQFRRKDGQPIWVQLSASVIEIEDVTCLLSMVRDITEAKAAGERLAAAQVALRESEARYRTAFETIHNAVNINRLEDGMYLDVNKAFLEIMGYEREEVIGKTTLELGIWVDKADQARALETLRREGSFRDEIQFKKKNGDIIWGMMSASVFEHAGVSCVLSFTQDITSVKAAQDEIRSLAFYDPLTSLPNRRLFQDRLRQILSTGTPHRRKKALLFVDLDNFKNLNDTLGHQTGDLLLQEAANRLRLCVRESDTVARLGGDEFLILLDGLSQAPEDAAAQAELVAGKVLVSLEQPFWLDGRQCLSSASIGISVFGDRRETPSEVMQQADIAMYQAKAAGRNTFRFFAPALQTAVVERAALEEELRDGIKANQFALFYQPQVDRNCLVGAEALLRWNHPRRGLLLPGEFISASEETGLIVPLGNWVLETACASIAAWERHSESTSISINISARQFRQPDFLEKVISALDRSGASPHNLTLELTESLLLDDVEETIARMEVLKSCGVRFSLDDFGTGYSSLSYLKRLPLDQLKIDRAFVRDLLVDVSSGAIAQAVISLGRAMGLSVIAEGVETQEQQDRLARMGCHAYQGFLFGRPIPEDDFKRMWLGAAECRTGVGQDVRIASG